MSNSKIAVIGAGISGLGAAWLLSKTHNVTVYEAEPRLGGHANTVVLGGAGKERTPVDTGFIVCNDRNYPNFLALMDELGVEYVPSEMSFGVSMNGGGFEYSGSDDVSALFAQKRNVFRPRFWSMVKSLLRFYRETSSAEPADFHGVTLDEYLLDNGYSKAFIRDHILPMAAAVWSTPGARVGAFPMSSFLRFCQNHGLLAVSGRPQWYTIKGGSKTYVEALRQATKAYFKTHTAVTRVERQPGGVTVIASNGMAERYDKVLIATHADTALDMLVRPTDAEANVLSAFQYEENVAVLHGDASFMPKAQKAWSSWNYLEEKVGRGGSPVGYLLDE